MKKYIFAIITCFCAFTQLFAQPMSTSTPDANQRKAEEAEATNLPVSALDLYDKVYDDTKDKSVLVKLAQLNYDLRDYEDSERRLQRLVLKDRKMEYTELRYLYALSLKNNGKYDDAIEQFKIYATDGKDAAKVAQCTMQIEGCEIGKKAKQPENILINNAGKTINGQHGDFSPSFSNGELYFVSLDAKGIMEDNKSQSQIYTTSKSGAEYSKPVALGTQINREDWWQGNVSISPDGKTMFFTRVELEGNAMKTSKIYYSSKGSDGWGAANEITGVNGEYIAKHPCEGELFGEKVLFFVANIPGGKGGDDIYYATRKSDGVYTLPVNLGDVINTSGSEWSPFYKDGKLYFSTDGKPSMGGLDVYESQWNGSVWSAPKAMPKGVNSSLDDFFYSVTPDGKSGFFVSNRPGPNNLKSKTCCDDIYTWEVERIKVNLMAKTFRFKKKGEKENMPLEACTVQIIDVTDKNPAKVDSKTNAKLNDFDFELLPEKSYMLIADRDGYQADTVTFNTVGMKKSGSVEKKLTLRRDKKAVEEPEPIKETERVVKINEPINLNNIYYDLDDDKILIDAEQDLVYLVELMNKYSDMKIELSSHTDAQGKDDYNKKLSQRRAESARTWMIGRGISGERIVPVGYGETLLLNECKNGVKCTDDQHRINRRTEFKIIEGPTSITIEKREKIVVPATEKKDTKTKTKTGGKQAFNRDWSAFFL
jgi:peptidoglycan-associated lipoprotein